MKRIITCSDGTWNKPGSLDRGLSVQTNVEKMFNSICSVGKDVQSGEKVQQVKAYDQGVGTGYSPLDRLSGGITGTGIDKNIKDMYTFICLNYTPGDELYLFGFSRGAYTARSIAGFIRDCGVLKPQNIQLVDEAYNLYRDRNVYTNPDSDMMRSWRSNYCFEDITRIMFIGVWDTVGSLGIPSQVFKLFNSNKYSFHDHTLSSYVKHAYHALAIDEKRTLFEPTLWEKSKSAVATNEKQLMEQRWFAGVHSNIGGGYLNSGLSDIALCWLIDKSTEAGLCFHNPPKVEVKPDCHAELRNSFTLRYWLWFARRREINLEDEKYNQTIDESVWERYRKDPAYRPPKLKKYAEKLAFAAEMQLQGHDPLEFLT